MDGSYVTIPAGLDKIECLNVSIVLTIHTGKAAETVLYSVQAVSLPDRP